MKRPQPIDRRAFLTGAGTAFLAALGEPVRAAADRSDLLFASACKDARGVYGAVLFTEDGAILHRIALPERGHDIAFDPVSGRAVAFARRPGNFAVAFDPTGATAPVTFTSQPGRHFYGHGVFSPDGRVLYSTENDFEAGAGMIGVYDASDGFAWLGEFPSFGIDPHEMLLMPDGRTLAVANGGIETHPDYGRAKLNLDRMQPSLVFIDRETGGLVERHVLPAGLRQLSIRHIAARDDATVIFGGQYEGPDGDLPPLVGRVQLGGGISLYAIPEPERAMFRNYIGSVAVSRDGARAAVSSPRGNVIAVLSSATGEILGRYELWDACGIAASAEGFVATSGEGAAGPLDEPQIPAFSDAITFDNHVEPIAMAGFR